MDLISWLIAFVAGAALVSFAKAALIGVLASVAIRVYQAVAEDWPDDVPEDLVGAAAMILVTVALAWVGVQVGRLIRRQLRT